MQHLSKIFSVAILFGTLSTTAGIQAAGGDDHKHNSDSGDHQHESGAMHDQHSDMSGMFMVKKEVDGYAVTFHVMKAQPGKEMGGSHDFMIKVEKAGKVLGDIVMNTKVVYPGGKAETKGVMKMGDWYMAGYDLDDSGQHQLMILFKTADGVKHQAGVYYGKD